MQLKSAATGAAGILSNMGMNSSKACVSGGIAFCVVMGIVGAAGLPEAAYLPKTGPTSLRFQVENRSRLVELPPLAMDEPDPGAATRMPPKSLDPIPAVKYSAASSPPETPNYMFSSPWFYPFAAMNYPAPQPPVEGASPTNASSMSLPPSDLLTVAPQMLVDYFRPQPARTNATSISAVPPVGFTPALPAPPPASTNTYETP
jgi:hypothetical protein